MNGSQFLHLKTGLGLSYMKILFMDLRENER